MHCFSVCLSHSCLGITWLNRIYSDHAFGFFDKRSGYEIYVSRKLKYLVNLVNDSAFFGIVTTNLFFVYKIIKMSTSSSWLWQTKTKTEQDWIYMCFWRKFSPNHKWVHKYCVLAFHPHIYYENTHPTHDCYDNAFQVDVDRTF